MEQARAKGMSSLSTQRRIAWDAFSRLRETALRTSLRSLSCLCYASSNSRRTILDSERRYSRPWARSSRALHLQQKRTLHGMRGSKLETLRLETNPSWYSQARAFVLNSLSSTPPSLTTRPISTSCSRQDGRPLTAVQQHSDMLRLQLLPPRWSRITLRQRLRKILSWA